MDIHTDIVYGHTGYDVIIYLRREVIATKIVENTACGGLSRERFKGGSRNFTHLSRTIGLTNLLDTTSLAASSRLQNAMKYCTKVRKTSPAGQKI